MARAVLAALTGATWQSVELLELTTTGDKQRDWSLAEHATPVHSGMPAQTPPAHTSVFVSASPSSHDVPSGLAGFEHRPVAGSQAGVAPTPQPAQTAAPLVD